MKRILLAIALTLAGISAIAENVNLMTYNLRTNDFFGLGFQSSRIDRLGRVIKESGADIVSVQELHGGNFNTLKTKSGLTGSFHDISGDNYGNGILWATSLGTPTITNVKVNPTNGSSDTEARSFMVAEFSSFCFISTHFSLNAEDRDEMVAQIITYANSAGKTVFLAGDLNAQPTFRAPQTLLNNNFVILNDLSQNTFPSDAPTALIDMILAFRKNSSDKRYNTISSGIPAAPTGIILKDISDHLPYNVTVNLSDGASGLYVTTDAADGEGSLSYCLNNVLENETIYFDVNATELMLSSAISKNNLTIDGLNLRNGQQMILKKLQADKFADLVGATVTFKNLILDGEDLSSAIGITADNSSTLNIENCILRNINSGGAANNGGACRIQGIATIKNSLFENNTQGSGTYGGGAICIYNSANVTIENSSFIGNTALAGGAIMANGTVATGYTLNVSNCTFANNEASLGTTNRRGGAVYLQGPTATESNATFTNCTFTGNSAANNGGAICAFTSANKKININLINSILTHNMSGGNKYSDIDVWNLDSRVYFPTAINCIYGSLLGTATAINWTSSINPTDINEAHMFDEKEAWMTGFERPAISTIDHQKVILLSLESIARNAGVVTAFTEDQVGNPRPATPSIGAMEYVPKAVVTHDQMIIADNIKLNVQGRQLSFTGLTAKTEMSIYGLAGNLLHKALVNNGTAVNLEKLQSNFIIVKVKNQSFKVLLK